MEGKVAWAFGPVRPALPSAASQSDSAKVLGL